MDVDDEEYEEGSARQRKKKKRSLIEPHEDARAEAVTLKESYDHLLSNNSFDVSFSSQAPGAADISSSQADNGFVDPFFADGIDLGIGDLGDELAREMGWGVPPTCVAPSFTCRYIHGLQSTCCPCSGHGLWQRPSTDGY